MGYYNEKTPHPAEDIVNSISDPLILIDKELQITWVSRSFYQTFEVELDTLSVIGKSLSELGGGWNRAELKELIRTSITTGNCFKGFELQYSPTAGNGEKRLSLDGKKLESSKGKPTQLLITVRDITEKYILQQKLLGSEKKLRELVEEINSIIIGFNAEGEITFFNHFSEKLFGYNRSEILGKSFVGTIIPTVDSKGFDNSSIPIRISKTPEEFYSKESEGKRKDGSRIYFSWSAKAFRDQAGNVTEILIDGNDITEKFLEREKFEEKQRVVLEQIVNDLPFGVALHEGPEFITTIVNKSYYDFAHGKGEIKGRAVRDVWPEIKDQIIPLLERVYKTGEPFHGRDVEFTVVRDSGPEKAWFSFSYLPFYGYEGVISGVLVWSVETTETVLARKEVWKTLESIGDGFYACDERWRFVYVNSQAEQMLGVSRDELLGKVLWEVFQGSGQTRLGEEYPRSAAGEKRDFELFYTPFNRWFHVRSFPREGGGISAYFEDITEKRGSEERLQEVTGMLEAFFDTSPVPLDIFDEKMRYLKTTNQTASYFGLTPHEMIGKPISELSPAFFKRFLKSVLTEVIENGTVYRNLEFSGEDPKTGLENYFFRASFFPVSLSGGKRGAGAVWIDITEQKIANLELQRLLQEVKKRAEEAEEGRRTLEALMENIPEGITLADTPDVKIRMMSLYGQKLLGENHIGLTAGSAAQRWKTFHPDGITPMSEEQLPLVRAVKNGDVLQDFELVQIDEMGNRLFLLCNAAPIKDRLGEVIGGILVWRDLSERRRAEEKIRESEERFRTLADNISQFAWMADTNGSVYWYNKRWYDYTGTTLEEMEGWGWTNAVHLDYVERVVSKLKRSWDAGVFWEDIFPLRSKDGTYRWFLSRALPIRDDRGEIVRWFGTNTDFTERKELEDELLRRTEQLASANKELESFSYSVAHDLRGPLRSVIGFSDLMIEDCFNSLNGECREYLARIKKGAVRMGSIIDDLLALSKISRQEMDIRDVNLSQMAQTIIEEIRETYPQRPAKVRIQKGLWVKADPRLMSAALLNLFSNAWKYSAKSDSPLIEFGTLEKEGQTIYFVKDNGAGFDMKHYHKLFEPFKRLHSEKTFAGTGIGLAIVERTVTRHGGKIWAESEPGHGAVFYFTLEIPHSDEG
ncbi:sensory box histidine kinase [Chitinispirillum alkaliphilum]|nr:sensory box histidine kinase [Chitinispirillum alkaliphilum]